MSELNANPFQSPIDTATGKNSRTPQNSIIPFGDLAKNWEFYRLTYNGILVAWTLAMALVICGIFGLIKVAVVGVFGMLVCNFFFFLGPVFDGYCQWLTGNRSRNFGLAILVLGILFTMSLALATIIEVKSLGLF